MSDLDAAGKLDRNQTNGHFTKSALGFPKNFCQNDPNTIY